MTSHSLVSRLSNVDWDFAGALSDSPFSAIHFHPCRFASQVPATLIGLLSSPGDLVLDPFAGSGTALVEAQRLDRDSIGVDVNPIAVLISQSKTLDWTAQAVELATEHLKQDAKHYVGEQLSAIRKPGQCDIPATVQKEKWYQPKVLRDLGMLWGFIQRLDGYPRVIAQAAFSASLIGVCRETRHWGYICDNTTPLASREGDVLSEFCGILDRYCRAYSLRDQELQARGARNGAKAANACVLLGDARTALKNITKSSVDLVLTSPPYFGVCDYVKAQRLSMEWFGFDIEPLRQSEIGARSKRHRTDAARAYVEDLRGAFTEMHRCMKRSAYLAVILGESASRGAVLPEFNKMLREIGLVSILETDRSVSTQRRLAPSIKKESLLVLKKG